MKSSARKKCLIRCDFSKDIGFGHLVRCLALADELKSSYNWLVSFAVLDNEFGCVPIHDAGYSCYLKKPELQSGLNEEKWLENVSKQIKPQVLIVDVRTNLTRIGLESIRSLGAIVVVIDDASDRRLAANMAFYPPVPQIDELNWNEFSGHLYVGWEWVLLRSQFEKTYEKLKDIQYEDSLNLPRIFVSMGGGDPYGISIKALRALDQINAQIIIELVIGPAFFHIDELDQWVKSTKHKHVIHKSATNMAKIMMHMDLAIVTFGMTAYELAVMGVPSILIGLTQDHVDSANLFSKSGIAINLGLFSDISEKAIANEAIKLIQNHKFRNAMSKASKSLVDGRGTHRVAREIVNVFAK